MVKITSASRDQYCGRVVLSRQKVMFLLFFLALFFSYLNDDYQLSVENANEIENKLQLPVTSVNSKEPFQQQEGGHSSTNFSATPETQFEMCFVTSVYSTSTSEGDRPPSVEDITQQNPTFRFFAFTNLAELEAPGWTVILKNLTQYKRFITQSRWAKFMAWTDSQVCQCQAVIYMDGFCKPKEKHSERYKRMAHEIAESEFGLFQNQHEHASGPLIELDRILAKNKDIKKNVDASRAWLLRQPDFQRNITMYVNTFIGYSPNSPQFREAAQFFWDHYSLEQDSWRDQPLWAYTLHKFNIRPPRLGTFKALFLQIFKNMGRGGHRYSEKADSNANST